MRKTGHRFFATNDAIPENMRDLDPTAFIQKNLPVMPVPDVPAILLHRASPTSGLWRLAEQDEQGFGPPYWAHCWAGGLALARYVLDNPAAVAGRRVLDLGAGSGLVAIAAAKAGARHVIAAEVDRYAVAALHLNKKLNGVSIDVIHGDLTECAPPQTDLLLVGDLFYAAALAERVTAFLDLSLACGIEVLVGDPWRAHLPVSRLAELARYSVTEIGSHAAEPSGVFTFVSDPASG